MMAIRGQRLLGSVGRGLESMAQEDESLSVFCRCGREVKLAANLAGTRGRCPGCDRPVRAPPPRRGGLGGSSNLTKAMKVVFLDPNFAPGGSGYYTTQLHSFVPGLAHLFVWGIILTRFRQPGEALRGALGFGPADPSWLPGFWVLAAAVGAAACTGPVAAAYRRYAGRSYGEDRKGYAEAGCFDIVRWVPLAVYAALILTLLGSGPRLPAELREPWQLLLLAVGLALLVSWLVALRVLRARFGTQRRRR
ncbi:MAG: hypothetical protein ACT4PM_01970 [Gemmatimonadales bacterium]